MERKCAAYYLGRLTVRCVYAALIMVLTACGRKRESSPAASAKNDLAAVDTIATPAGTYVVVAVDPARVEFKMQIRGSDGHPF